MNADKRGSRQTRPVLRKAGREEARKEGLDDELNALFLHSNFSGFLRAGFSSAFIRVHLRLNTAAA
jgi:hypothetical protein